MCDPNSTAKPDTETPDDDLTPMAKALFGWVSWKGTKPLFLWGLAALSAGLILADLIVHRHEKLLIAETFGFYGFFGFAAFSFAVLTGWPLGSLLRRDENYYDDLDEPGSDTEGGR